MKMIRTKSFSAFIPVCFALLLFSCNSSIQTKKEKKNSKELSAESSVDNKGMFSIVAQLPKKLKEISGMEKDGNFLWAISDNPKAAIYKLDLSGNPVQELTVENTTVSDVEDVAVDADYLYIADIGDNDGTRGQRQILKIEKSSIGNDEKAKVKADVISFSFPSQDIKKKKDNDYDCEAIFSNGNNLYLFTKRRSDGKTELFELAKTKGNQTPKSITTFNSEGMITGASINEAGKEVALCGYQHGHQQPFIWLLNEFKGNNFFSGQQKRYVLTTDKKDWQVESITFKDENSLLFACETTSDMPATLYSISKNVFK
jgi:hypothetical protein